MNASFKGRISNDFLLHIIQAAEISRIGQGRQKECWGAKQRLSIGMFSPKELHQVSM